MTTATDNKMMAMFNMAEVKKAIARCPKDEIVILCGLWSINRPKYDDSDPNVVDQYNDDWLEMEDAIDQMLFINDYDDLCCDPHGIMSE